MRILLAILTVLLAGLLASAAADPSVAGGPGGELLSDLTQATYVTVTDLHAAIPNGEFVIREGVVGMFTRMEQRTTGLFLGDLSVELTRLKSGEGVLDLLHELTRAEHSISLNVHAAYVSASIESEMQMEPSGFIKAIRSWDELSDAEREELTSIYLQSYSDGWLDEAPQTQEGSNWAGGAGMSATPLKLRDPRGKEVYIAAWGGGAGGQDAGPEAGAATEGEWRYDYRVNEDGKTVSLQDYFKGIMLYQTPWAPEEGEFDNSLHFSDVSYTYIFNPPTGGEANLELSHQPPRLPGRMKTEVVAQLWVEQQTSRLALVSAPWVEYQSAVLELGTAGIDAKPMPLTLSRGGEGVSDWMLFAEGAELQPTVEYTLRLEGEYDVPDSFAATGYAGVYRFDLGALWPFDKEPVGVSINVSLPDGEWNTVASNDAVVTGHPMIELEQPETFAGQAHSDFFTARWDGTTRNEMLVATQFPSVDIPTNWGTLKTFTPPELADSVARMDYVNATGAMIDYYGGLWGQRGATVQPLFIIPGESGVQAFEDAGLVFILGGDRPGIPLVAHEVAHLWWGYDVDGPRWFFEGMANYAASKFNEYCFGEGGPAAGQGDPLFYRRYIINFGLGYELPGVSFLRRDELDDSAAIYHNSAGFFLTADNRLPYGLDGVLKRIYEAGLNAPPISHEEMRGLFADQSEELGRLWDAYVERGEIEHNAVDDLTFREFVFTPGRENYVKMLHWLSPARRKAAIGDYDGALYCANRALEFRAEPKDYLYIADLTLKSGRSDEAMERATALLEREDLDAGTRVKAVYLQAKVYRQRGDAANEKAALEVVVKDGPAASLLTEVQAAQERLKEL